MHRPLVGFFRLTDKNDAATDNLTFEVYPGERNDVDFPVHVLHLVEMGMTQGQNWQLPPWNPRRPCRRR